ncbi:MAG TPA: prephenate dehydratase [Methanothrix sp.]|nr:prephenate dehydratase [Methanothrix sp.]HQJ79198.1 prephenate dehydratase [Methanothrix sp.]HUM80724.1 prephenate dehydratase [Methanothrix sp.]
MRPDAISGPCRIAVLGPQGTYSEKAALLWCKERRASNLVYFPDFESVLDSVRQERVEAGIVPVENSLEGAVTAVMDLLLRLDVVIVGEVNLPIRHCLVGRGGGEIRVILSHPQALAQCRKYLHEHYPDAEIRTTGSTSHAARLAQEFPEMAAIAGQDAAERYGLSILAREIQDASDNITRFIVVAREGVGRSGRDKTSLVIYLDRDRPGALYSILEEFARRNINLTRIESRPSRKGLGDYYFYIDLEGHMQDQEVGEAVAAARDKAAMVKVLGSYPRAL